MNHRTFTWIEMTIRPSNGWIRSRWLAATDSARSSCGGSSGSSTRTGGCYWRHGMNTSEP